MAAVTVFVDDAVLGRLPPVCVEDGLQTDDRLILTQDVGGRTGLGVAWLLILAGPLGWIGLFVIAATRPSNELITVTLPYCEAAHLRMRRTQRSRSQATLVFMGTIVASFVSLLFRTHDSRLLALVLAIVAAGALVRAIFETIVLGKATVRLSLDASRRWITLSGVHPNFEAAMHQGGPTSSNSLQGQRFDSGTAS